MSVLPPAHWKTLLHLAWPLIISNAFWNLQLTIDRIFLGQFSTASLAAAMTVMGVFWTPMAFLQQTASYVTTFVAQYHGSQEVKKISPIFWQAIYFSLGGGVFFLLLILVSRPIFSGVGHAPALQDLEVSYFNAICWSALPMVLVATLSGLFIGLGQTRTVIGINAMGVLFNILFDYLFIFGKGGFPPMGIRGAGYATTLGNWVSVFWAIWCLQNPAVTPFFKWSDSKAYSSALMKRFLRFGVPSGIQWSLEGLAFTVFFVLMGRFPDGGGALASSSIAFTLLLLSILPVLGIAQAVMMLVGQYMGANTPDSAYRITWVGAKLSCLYIFLMGLSFILIPQVYLGWFENHSDPPLWNQVAIIVPRLLMMVGVFTFFDSLNLNFSFALKGAGDTKFVSLASLIIPWPLMVLPMGWLGGVKGAVYYAWLGACLYVMTQALVFIWRFQKGRWKTMQVIEAKGGQA